MQSKYPRSFQSIKVVARADKLQFYSITPTISKFFEILVDLSKALDTVNTSILLRNLKNLLIGVLVSEWFSSFLTMTDNSTWNWTKKRYNQMDYNSNRSSTRQCSGAHSLCTVSIWTKCCPWSWTAKYSLQMIYYLYMLQLIG